MISVDKKRYYDMVISKAEDPSRSGLSDCFRTDFPGPKGHGT